MNKLLASTILSIGILTGCKVYQKPTDISSIVKPTYSEIRIEAGIVAGKTEITDYKKYDSLSNNYSVFIITEMNNNTEYFNQPDRGLHRKVAEDSVVHILYRDVFEKGKYIGYNIERIVTLEESRKEELHLKYKMNSKIKLRD